MASSELAGTVLLVQPSDGTGEIDGNWLREAGLSVAQAATIHGACDLLMRDEYQVVVAVVSANDNGIPAGAIEYLRVAAPESVFVVVLGEDCDGLVPQMFIHDSVVGVMRSPYEADALVRMAAQGIALHRSRDLASGLRGEQWGEGVLLVEDCAADAYLCRERLQEVLGDVEVFQATTLEDGIELTRRHAISLALVDLGLPDAHGLDVVRQLRSSVPGLPLVVLSGMAEDLSEQALALGAQQVLSKNEMTDVALTRCLRRARLLAGATQEVHYLATHDPLTGLFNSQQFRDRMATTLARLKRQAAGCALIYLDLDGFKPVNDTHGHTAGDQVLSVCADRLRSTLREFDIAGRMGGDEFAVLVEGTADIGDLSHIAERIVNAVAEPIDIGDGVCVNVSASLGVALFPADGKTAANLIAAADAAMYRAKRRGPGRYVFHHNRPSSLPPVSLLPIDRALREAVLERRFRLAYQPLVDMEDHLPVSFEALLRLDADGWRRDCDGLRIDSAQLVQLLEQMELMDDVGEWVLTEACRSAAARRKKGCPARVAVNLSSQQLARGNFAAVVLELLNRFKLPADILELEITERVLNDTPVNDWEQLQVLREEGVRVILDDFGVGTSSLHSLRELPMDGLKVDGVLLDDAAEDPVARRLLGGLIELAHNMGYVVTAERIEHEHQATLLRRMGCDYGQGYLYGRPELV